MMSLSFELDNFLFVKNMWDEWDSFEINSGLNYFNPFGELKQNLPTIYISHLLPPTTCDHNSTPNKTISYAVVFQLLHRMMERSFLVLWMVSVWLFFLVDWLLLTDETIWEVFGYPTTLKIILYAVVFQVLPKMMERSLFGDRGSAQQKWAKRI